MLSEALKAMPEAMHPFFGARSEFLETFAIFFRCGRPAFAGTAHVSRVGECAGFLGKAQKSRVRAQDAAQQSRSHGANPHQEKKSKEPWRNIRDMGSRIGLTGGTPYHFELTNDGKWKSLMPSSPAQRSL